MCRPTKEQVLSSLWDLRELIYKVRSALGTEGVSVEAEAEFIQLGMTALENNQVLLESYLPTAHKPKLWEFEKCGFESRVPRRRCRGYKPDGKPCYSAAQVGSVFCHYHQGQDNEWTSVEKLLSQHSPEDGGAL